MRFLYGKQRWRKIETNIIAIMSTSSPQPIMRTLSGPIRPSNICELKKVDTNIVKESAGATPASTNFLIRAAGQGIRRRATK